MNLIPATITKIQSVEPLNLITLAFGESQLSMICLDLPHDIHTGKCLTLTVNPSYIALAKNPSEQISYRNQIPATIQAIQQGELLSTIQLQAYGTTLESIITTTATQTMALRVGEPVVMLIKATEIAIHAKETRC